MPTVVPVLERTILTPVLILLGGAAPATGDEMILSLASDKDIVNWLIGKGDKLADKDVLLADKYMSLKIRK